MATLACSGILGFKDQGYAIVAVALAAGLRTIVEYMALMAAAATAMVFSARHYQFKVELGGDGTRQGLPEAGPTGAAFIFGLGAE